MEGTLCKVKGMLTSCEMYPSFDTVTGVNRGPEFYFIEACIDRQLPLSQCVFQ